MYLCAKYPEKVTELAPPAPIELILRAHACDPLHFVLDWVKLVGKVIDFRPKAKDTSTTNVLWKELYSVDLDKEFSYSSNAATLELESWG